MRSLLPLAALVSISLTEPTADPALLTPGHHIPGISYIDRSLFYEFRDIFLCQAIRYLFEIAIKSKPHYHY